jgi:multiple sugar transport system permease protein
MQLAIGIVRGSIPRDAIVLSSPAYDAVILTVCTLLSILPLVVIFLIIQKQFVEGVERSGIVG